MAASLALALAAANLAGWAAGGGALLTRVKADWPAMTPWTSVLLAGVAIALIVQWAGRPGRGRVVAGRIVALLVLVACCFFGAEYLVGFDGGVDQWFFPSEVSSVVATWPGRPSPQTLVGAGALALLTMLARFEGRAADALWAGLMLVAALVPLFAVGGYLFQTVALASITPWTGMSVLTALGVILLTASLLALRPDRWPVSAVMRLPEPALVARLLATIMAVPLLVWLVREIALGLGADASAAWVWSVLVATMAVAAVVTRYATLQQRAAGELARSRDLLQTTYDAMFEPILLLRALPAESGLTDDFVVLAANPAAVSSLSVAGGGPVGAALSQSETAVAGSSLRARYASSLRTGDSLVLVDWQGVDPATGQEQWLDVRAVPTPDGYLALTWQDVTQRHEAADQLHSALARAEDAAQAKATFLANMSHELRTPLHAVVGTLSLLAGSGVNRAQLALVRQGQGAAQHLLRVINDILDYSKLEAGGFQAHTAPFRLDDVLREVGLVMAASVRTGTVELVLDTDPGLPERLVGDELRLRQALLNLVGNAVKFTDRGSVILAVNLLGSDEGQASVEFRVLDTGPGMTREEAGRVFEQFAQADPSTTRARGGTGLGLTIANRLVALMGGELRLESEPGRGSTFSFTLRLPVAAPEPASAPASAALTPGRALLVGGSSTGRRVASRVLEAGGWSAATAPPERAAAAVDSAAEAGSPYKLILLDCLTVPDREVLADLGRAVRDADSPPVVALTDQAGSIRPPADGSTGLVRSQVVVPYTPALLWEAIARANDPAAAEGRGHAAVGGTGPGPRLAGLSVLVADDNDINREVASALLVREGAAVAVARDGREAVAAVAGQQEPFDAVLMDIHMPVLDGLEATQEIRARVGAADLPIIAMTASAWDEDRELALSVGMSDHLGKPFEPEDLVAVLLRWTQAPGSAAAAESGGGEVPGSSRREDAILDEQGALARFGGDAALYAGMLARLPVRIENWREALESADAAGSAKDLCSIAHNVKGSAATMGAQALSTAAADLEAAARQGQGPSDLAPLVVQLQQAMADTVAEVRRRAG